MLKNFYRTILYNLLLHLDCDDHSASDFLVASAFAQVINHKSAQRKAKKRMPFVAIPWWQGISSVLGHQMIKVLIVGTLAN